MRDGNLRGGGGGQRRAYAGNDLDRDAGFAQCFQFLAGAPEDQRIATLQPHHVRTQRRKFYQQSIDFRLRHALAAAALADIVELRGLRNQFENARADQIVVQDNFRRTKNPRGFQRQQLRITRPRADKVDLAFRYSEIRCAQLHCAASPAPGRKRTALRRASKALWLARRCNRRRRRSRGT